VSGRKKVSESGSVKSRNESDTGAAAQLSALTGGIAHDLNTVITTIYGYSEMALGSLESREETARNIRMIIGAADRAKILTGQLLDLSRRAAQKRFPSGCPPYYPILSTSSALRYLTGYGSSGI
jgi:signal transduction histidine kinase